MQRTITVLATLMLVLTACGDSTGSETTTADASTEPLVVYSGRNENFAQPVVDAFVESTGIDVEVRYAGTGELATTLLAEGDASPADVFWAQDPAFIGGIANEGMLAELDQTVLDLVPSRFRDGEGRWVGITGRSRVMVFNTDLVPSADLPSSVWELTEDRWNGRLGIAPTNGSFVAFVTGMVLLEGEDRTREWLAGIAANDPIVFDGNGAIVDAVVAGDVPAGLVNHYYLLQRVAEQGDVPASNLFFADDDPGALVMAAGAGVLTSSTRPDAAEQFVAHLLSEESQRHFLTLFEYPLVEGIGTPADQPPLEELPVVDLDLTDTADTLEPALELIAEAGLS